MVSVKILFTFRNTGFLPRMQPTLSQCIPPPSMGWKTWSAWETWMKLEFWETFWSDTERSSYMWVVLQWLHGVLLLQLSSNFYNYSAPQREHCHNCLNFCPGFDRQSLCSCLLTTRLRPLLLTVLFSSQFLPSLLSLHCLFLSSKDKLWRPGKSAPQKMSMTDTVNERERERERD